MTDTTIIALAILVFFGITSVIVLIKHDLDSLIKYSAIYTGILGAMASYYFTKDNYDQKLALIETAKDTEIALVKSSYNGLYNSPKKDFASGKAGSIEAWSAKQWSDEQVEAWVKTIMQKKKEKENLLPPIETNGYK